jgi:hypothetical protein
VLLDGAQWAPAESRGDLTHRVWQAQTVAGNTDPGDNGGAYKSFLFIRSGRGGGADESAHLADLRRQLGDEAVARMRRTQERMRNPRPLPSGDRSVLDAALAPVLRDLRATGAIVPEVRYETWEDRGPDYVCAFIAPPGQAVGGQGVRVAVAQPVGERVARLAEQVQEWGVEALAAAGRPATWPECPEHPASHPLEAAVSPDGTAIWRCPRSGRAIDAIGG